MHRFGLLVVGWVLVAVLGVVRAAEATTVVCDQPDNAVLFCRPTANPCVVSGNFDVPGGCVLDVGVRTVRFQGELNVHRAALVVRAGAIVIDGRVAARPTTGRAGSVLLTAAAAITATTRARVDVSGDSAGLMRLVASGPIDLVAGAQLNAKATVTDASGGLVYLLAGGAVTDAASIDVGGGNGGSGGTVVIEAGTTLTIAQSIAADGGAGDGGDIDLAAGDDVSVQRAITASSTTGGSGGAIRMRAGIDGIAGSQRVGGNLAVVANLTADGSSDGDGGYDGGEIALAAFGNVLFDGQVRANGGSPDGSGGAFAAESSDLDRVRMTARDGEVRLRGAIVLRGVGSESGGGDVEIDAGTDLVLDAAIDVSGGASGGDVITTAARNSTINGRIAAGAGVAEGDGGSIVLRSGTVAFGTLTIGASSGINARSGDGGAGGDALVAGCNLTVAANVVVDVSGRGARLDLGALGGFGLGAKSRYLARPSGVVTLTHPASVVPQLGAGVVFDPAPRETLSATSPVLPACPVCGDGIVEGAEVCDDGNTQNGDCCAATCSAVTCAIGTPVQTSFATPTVAPTATRTATPLASVTQGGVATPAAETPGPTGAVTTATVTLPTTGETSSPTSAPSTTPQVTPSATPSATPSRTSVVPSSTPDELPVVAAKPVADCAGTLTKATERLANAHIRALGRCALAAASCTRVQSGRDRTACADEARRRCDRQLARIATAHAVFDRAFAKRCGGVPPVLPVSVLRAPEGLGFAAAEAACAAEVGLALTSSSAIGACVRTRSACEVERTLGAAIPLLAGLLDGVVDVGALGLCVPPADDAALAALATARPHRIVRCETAIAVSTERFLRRRVATIRDCVDSLFQCALTTNDCSARAARCGERLDRARADATRALARQVRRACGTLGTSELLDDDGVGFASAASGCADVGVGAIASLDDVVSCVARTASCAGERLLRAALPRVDDASGPAEPFCPRATVR